MRKWGHQEGTGLGSRGDGIVHALSAEHAKASGSSKQNDGKRGWVHSTSAMGRLVNLNENEQRKADLERYGDPSEVVCLRNVVAGPHEVDGGLADEIAEECNKNGCVTENRDEKRVSLTLFASASLKKSSFTSRPFRSLVPTTTSGSLCDSAASLAHGVPSRRWMADSLVDDKCGRRITRLFGLSGMRKMRRSCRSSMHA